MFEFSYTNFPGFLLAFIPALINIGLVLYILFSFPRTRLVHVFTVLTLCAGLWQLNDALARISTSATMTDFWDCILSAGWILVGPLCLHFSLLYTKKIRADNSLAFLCSLYIPAFIFMGLYQTHIYAHDFQHRPLWGWVNYHDKDLWDIMMIYWISALVLSSCIIMFLYAYQVRQDKMLGPQALLISMGIAIPTISGVISQVVFPTILRIPSVPITSSFLSVLSIATVIAFKRYRLFTISELITNDILLDKLPVAVLSISDSGDITYVNQFAADMFRIDRRNLRLYKFDEMLSHSEEQYSSVFQHSYRSALKGENVYDAETTFVVGGKTVNIVISASPIVNNYRVRGALLCIRDISALKHSEHSLQQKNVELQQKNAKLEEYAFIASHDLREPLRKIITFSGMIKNTEKDHLSPKAQSYFERISGTAERMQSMVDDLLSLSIISEQNALELNSLDIILREVLQDLEIQIKEKNATVSFDPLPAMHVNPLQIKQLFQNLILNSLKFSREGVPPVIRITAAQIPKEEARRHSLLPNENYYKITYSDNGIGFEEEYAEKIFQMFQRLHGKAEYEGTGIGLAICKKIVENHHGVITASGKVNEGAVFNIILPC
jgi:PAS domain S-box-containing protein